MASIFGIWRLYVYMIKHYVIITSQTFILEDKEEVIISDGYGIIPVHDMERYLGQGSTNRSFVFVFLTDGQL